MSEKSMYKAGTRWGCTYFGIELDPNTLKVFEELITCLILVLHTGTIEWYTCRQVTRSFQGTNADCRSAMMFAWYEADALTSVRLTRQYIALSGPNQGDTIGDYRACRQQDQQ